MQESSPSPRCWRAPVASACGMPQDRVIVAVGAIVRDDAWRGMQAIWGELHEDAQAIAKLAGIA